VGEDGRLVELEGATLARGERLGLPVDGGPRVDGCDRLTQTCDWLLDAPCEDIRYGDGRRAAVDDLVTDLQAYGEGGGDETNDRTSNEGRRKCMKAVLAHGNQAEGKERREAQGPTLGRRPFMRLR